MSCETGEKCKIILNKKFIDYVQSIRGSKSVLYKERNIYLEFDYLAGRPSMTRVEHSSLHNYHPEPQPASLSAFSSPGLIRFSVPSISGLMCITARNVGLIRLMIYGNCVMSNKLQTISPQTSLGKIFTRQFIIFIVTGENQRVNSRANCLMLVSNLCQSQRVV